MSDLQPPPSRLRQGCALHPGLEVVAKAYLRMPTAWDRPVKTPLASPRVEQQSSEGREVGVAGGRKCGEGRG